MMKDPKHVEIIEWLYTNHDAYSSAEEWRKAFVDFLNRIFNHQADGDL